MTIIHIKDQHGVTIFGRVFTEEEGVYETDKGSQGSEEGWAVKKRCLMLSQKRKNQQLPQMF